MKISVIIPTLNEEKNIGRTLGCLAKQVVKPTEVIVVDGGSSDKTRQIAKRLSAKVYKTKKGVGWQRNFGGKRASGDLLVFFDADVSPKPDFLERLEQSFAKHKLGVACPLFHPERSRLDIILVYWFFNTVFFVLQRVLPSGAGMCIAVKRNIFEKVDGFDGKLVHDDIHFIRRASRKGTFAVVPIVLDVSDRRFRKEGTIKMLGLYLLLSVFFLFGAFRLANKVKYNFAHYEKKTR